MLSQGAWPNFDKGLGFGTEMALGMLHPSPFKEEGEKKRSHGIPKGHLL